MPLLPLAAGGGCAAPVPVMLKPLLVDRPHNYQLNATGTCPIWLEEVRDVRKDGSSLGNVMRMVKAPPDVEGWLRSGLDALRWRGITLVGPPPRGGVQQPVRAEVALKVFSLNAVLASKTGDVVISLKLSHGGLPLLERTYRGSLVENNWNSSAAELQGLADRAFAKALDQMADDMRRYCRSS